MVLNSGHKYYTDNTHSSSHAISTVVDSNTTQIVHTVIQQSTLDLNSGGHEHYTDNTHHTAVPMWSSTVVDSNITQTTHTVTQRSTCDLKQWSTQTLFTRHAQSVSHPQVYFSTGGHRHCTESSCPPLASGPPMDPNSGIHSGQIVHTVGQWFTVDLKNYGHKHYTGSTLR